MSKAFIIDCPFTHSLTHTLAHTHTPLSRTRWSRLSNSCGKTLRSAWARSRNCDRSTMPSSRWRRWNQTPAKTMLRPGPPRLASSRPPPQRRQRSFAQSRVSPPLQPRALAHHMRAVMTMMLMMGLPLLLIVERRFGCWLRRRRRRRKNGWRAAAQRQATSMHCDQAEHGQTLRLLRLLRLLLLMWMDMGMAPIAGGERRLCRSKGTW